MGSFLWNRGGMNPINRLIWLISHTFSFTGSLMDHMLIQWLWMTGMAHAWQLNIWSNWGIAGLHILMDRMTGLHLKNA